ncbi:serine hydrolase domain-containing protein [Dactylosporangium darangshiense]|uniref:serine hydrolase domain-containing protein n=1 Tax=Dactylosporangium darangshiense TaxID=579108 RepID=UPI00363248C3
MVQGFARDRYEPVRAAFAENLASGVDAGAALCVTVDGETVVDLWGGHADAEGARPWQRDTIVNVYSTTKTVTALVALLLADRGELDFAAPVARYWPEFAANGKQDVKVSHVMSHSAGLPAWRSRCAPRTSTTGRRPPRCWPRRPSSGSPGPCPGITR